MDNAKNPGENRAEEEENQSRNNEENNESIRIENDENPPSASNASDGGPADHRPSVSQSVDNNSERSFVSLKVKSEILNITNRSNVTLRSVIRITDDDNQRGEPSSQSNNNEINAEFTLLYSDRGFTSSESLLNKVSSKIITVQPSRTNEAANLPTNSTDQHQPRKPPPYVATPETGREEEAEPPPQHGAPPTYSALMRIGPTRSSARSLRVFGLRRDLRLDPFEAPLPPPTYAQSQGCMPDRLAVGAAQYMPESRLWGTEPIALVCPHCNSYVVTSVRTRRSNLTHYSAMALCICGCWPCCLLPYCMKSCKSSAHECPTCHHIVGIYDPWQVLQNSAS